MVTHVTKNTARQGRAGKTCSAGCFQQDHDLEFYKVLSQQEQIADALSQRLSPIAGENRGQLIVMTMPRTPRKSFFFPTFVVPVCRTPSFAKSHYLLSDSQAAKLPTFFADKAEETGVQIKKNGGITITTCSAGKASAVARCDC